MNFPKPEEWAPALKRVWTIDYFWIACTIAATGWYVLDSFESRWIFWSCIALSIYCLARAATEAVWEARSDAILKQARQRTKGTLPTPTH